MNADIPGRKIILFGRRYEETALGSVGTGMDGGLLLANVAAGSDGETAA
jgi:hypothetical protein